MILSLFDDSRRHPAFAAVRSPAPVKLASFVSVVLLVLPGCALLGVEPDEIDLVTGETGEAGGAETGEDAAESEGGATGTDGEPTTGDGDGDPAGTGDGDGDPNTGDGDGDATGDTGETDTDTGGGPPCEELESVALTVGVTPITIPPGASEFIGACGGAGPEQLFRVESDSDAEFSLALIDADFDAALALLDSCGPLSEVSCELTPDPLIFQVQANVPTFVLVDAIVAEGGSGTLELLAL